MSDQKIPIHKWTNGGKYVHVLQNNSKDGKGHGGYQYPLTVGSKIVFEGWTGAAGCGDGQNGRGNGGHGWPWGLSIGDGKDPDWSSNWQVWGCLPEDVVPCENDFGKVKWRAGELLFSGDWLKASNYCLAGQMAWVFQHTKNSPASTSGERAPASTSGWYAPASTSGGYAPASTSGERAPASTSGGCAPAVCSYPNNKAKSGPYGCIALAWYNKKADRNEMRCAEVGKGDGKDKKLKAHVWYELNAMGKFVEVKE